MTATQKATWGLGIMAVAILAYMLRSVLAPFLIAAFLAYLGDPLVERLTRIKIPRLLAATLVFLIIMAVVVLLLTFFIPLLSRQIALFFNRLPDRLLWLQQAALPLLNQHLGTNISFDLPSIKTLITQHWQQAGNVAVTVWTTISRSGLALIAWLTKLLLIPVVTFYLLRDWDKVLLGIRQLLPRRIEAKAIQLAQECDEVLSAFLRGQLLVMVGLAIIYSLGLAIVGLDLALLVGISAGLLAIVPYLGIIIGILAASIAALIQFHDGIHVLYVVIVFIVGHFIEHFVLTPWLVGHRIGLHPVAVIFAILAGGHLFGFVGVLLALPVAAVVMVLLRHLKQHYVQSGLYGI